MAGEWIVAAIAPLIALLVLWRGTREIPGPYLTKWQERFDVEVAPETEPFLRGRLRRARAIRAWPVAVGVVVAGLPSYLNLLRPGWASDFANPIVENAWVLGGLLGALAAERFADRQPALGRPAPGGGPPGPYLHPRWVRSVWLAVPLTVALAALSTLLGAPGWWWAWTGVGAATIAAVGLLFGLRLVTDRPAPAAGDERRDVDDALRADGAHHVAGAAVALAGIGVAAAVPVLSGWTLLLVVPVYVLSFLTLVLWWTLARDARWSLRRARA